jgi:hypothetical protein
MCPGLARGGEAIELREGGIDCNGYDRLEPELYDGVWYSGGGRYGCADGIEIDPDMDCVPWALN